MSLKVTAARQRHVARRADDRLRLRGLPFDRSARPADAAVDPDRDCDADGERRRSPQPVAHRFSSTRRPTCARRRWRTASAASTRSSSRTATPITSWASTRCAASTCCSSGVDAVLRGRSRRAADLAAHVLRTCSTPPAAGRRRSAAHAVRDRRRRSSLGGVEIVPVPVLHGPRPILGFPHRRLRVPHRLQRDSRRRRGRCSTGVATLVLDALRDRPHPTHFSVAEALEVVARLGPERAYFTHICHDLPHAATCARLPAGVELAYDGLRSGDRIRPGADRVVAWTSFIFPTTRGRARWTQPVLALGNFDGVHRGHRKILERLRRVAAERGATSVVMTFDPHPPRVVRPDKAPPLLMTKAQKLEAIARGRRAGRGHRAVHAGAVALGSGNVRAHRARRLAARRRSVGRRELSVRPRSRRQLLAAAGARRALRLQGREDRSGPLQGLRRQQHADPPAGRRRARGRGRRAARPSVLSSTARSCDGDAPRPDDRISDRESLHRERAAAAARRLCDDGDDRRRSSTRR